MSTRAAAHLIAATAVVMSALEVDVLLVAALAVDALEAVEEKELRVLYEELGSDSWRGRSMAARFWILEAFAGVLGTGIGAVDTADTAGALVAGARLETLACASLSTSSVTVGSLHSLGREMEGLTGSGVVFECVSLGKLW